MPILGTRAMCSAIAYGLTSAAAGPGILPANNILAAYNGTNLFITRPTTSGATSFYYSSDLVNWTVIQPWQLTPYIPNSGNVRYYNGYWYAFLRTDTNVFTRSLFRSSDLSNWTNVWNTGVSSNWRLDINTATGKFLATSGNKTSLTAGTSSNGSTWSTITLPANAYGFNNNKGWNNNTIVTSNYGSGTSSYAYRSTDNGANWTAISPASWTASGVADYNSGAAYGNGIYLILFTQGADQISKSTDDGVTWTAPSNPGFLSFAWNIWFSTIKSKFIVTYVSSYSNYISTSTDGVTWTHYGPLSATISEILETSTKIYGYSAESQIVDLTSII